MLRVFALRSYNLPDIGDHLIHFTGCTGERFAVPDDIRNLTYPDRLAQILYQGRIRAVPTFGRGGRPIVAFTESSQASVLQLISEGIYTPWGIGFSKQFIFDQGGKPVLYVRGDEWDAATAALPDPVRGSPTEPTSRIVVLPTRWTSRSSAPSTCASVPGRSGSAPRAGVGFTKHSPTRACASTRPGMSVRPSSRRRPRPPGRARPPRRRARSGPTPGGQPRARAGQDGGRRRGWRNQRGSSAASRIGEEHWEPARQTPILSPRPRGGREDARRADLASPSIRWR